MSQEIPKTYSVPQAADALGCSASFVYKMIEQRRLKVCKLGGMGRILIKHEDLLAAFQEVEHIPGSHVPVREAG